MQRRGSTTACARETATGSPRAITLQSPFPAADPDLDALAALAAHRFDAPIALVTRLDPDRQVFLARQGTTLTGTPIGQAFCAYAVASDDVMVVPDATRDARFAANPLVTASPAIRFYAGAPLTLGGRRVGTLCVIDTVARPEFTPRERAELAMLADLARRRLEQAATLRSGRLANAMARNSTYAFVCADADNRVTAWSPGAERLFGWSKAEMLGASLSRIIPKRDRARHEAGLARLAAGEPSRLAGKTIEVCALHRDGRELTIELTLSVADHLTDGFNAIIRDITERKAAEHAVAHDRAILSAVVENLPAMLFVRSLPDQRYVLFNRFGEELCGVGRDELLGRTHAEIVHSPTTDLMMRRDAEALALGALVSEDDMVTRAGDRRPLRTRRIVVNDPDGTPSLLIGISEDLTALREAERRSNFLVRHDALTSLVNRATLVDLLDAALARGAAPAVLSLDLDRFRAVNDFFGHTVGDALLVAVAAELEGLAGEGDVVARLGGDEFAILHGSPRPGSVDALARRIVAALGRPFRLEGAVANVGASVGVAVAPSDGTTGEELMRNADLALARVRAGPRVGVGYFEPEMDSAARARRELEAELRSALASGAIIPHYQPIADASTGEIEGFEALARWTHATMGMIPPDRFIAVAEESNLIIDLGRAMLTAVVTEAASWERPLTVAVNVSPVQLAHADFVDELSRLLAATGLPGARLVLEVTENLLIADVDRARDTLNAACALGVTIALDDFGKGYSSLGQLRQLPFDKIKIDRSFVADMLAEREAMAVVRAAIGLARGLDLPIVAEGVETKVQLDRLRLLGCTHAQGWHIGRPAPIASFSSLVGRPAEIRRAVGRA